MSNELTTTIKASLDVYKGKFETKLVEFKKTHAGLVYKMEEEEQRTKARADRREVNKVIKELDEEHDSIKAPFLEASRIVDATRKNIKDEFLLLSDGIGDQLKAHDEKIQEKLDFISKQGDVENGSSAQIQTLIDHMVSIEIDDSFCDKKADAALLKEQTLQKLSALKKQAEDQEELEQLRRDGAGREAKEREERIAREAAEKAKAEAEAKAQEEANRVERERQEAAAKAAREQEAKDAAAEQAIKEAEAKAARAAQEEREKIEREQREKAEKEAAAQKAEADKKAKQEYRAKIHKQAKESLVKNGIDEKLAVKIVELIRDGKIQNVDMVY